MATKSIKKTLTMSEESWKLLEDYAKKRDLSISAAIRVMAADMKELYPDRFASDKKEE